MMRNYKIPAENTTTPAATSAGNPILTLPLKTGGTFRLGVANTTDTPAWTSSNTNVATVSSNGTVTAKARGNAVITATVGGRTLRIAVIVSD